MSMKLGELCAGYGGLGMAVEEVFGAELAWVSEYDEAPSKILAHHWPNVPNHGDMTKIDWYGVETVDIISGGTPCQDLSHAGRRAGMTEGTRSNLWVHMREAIATIRPKFVVWENVRGAFSAEASSDLEQCPGCVGDASDGRVVLRALGRVLGDFSDLGYDTQWRGLRASDVGAPHGRFRVFVLAKRQEPSNSYHKRPQGPHDPPGTSSAGRGGHPVSRAGCDTPPHTDGKCDRAQSGSSSSDATRDGSCRRHGLKCCGNSSPDRNSKARRLVESRSVPPQPKEGAEREAGRGAGRDSNTYLGTWGEYEPAIRRWEQVLGRRAPAPTEPTGRNGSHRLSARFAEWMMGLPNGWIVDVPGVSRNESLKAAGNGVVPQQAIAALQDMLAAFASRELAA